MKSIEPVVRGHRMSRSPLAPHDLTDRNIDRNGVAHAQQHPTEYTGLALPAFRQRNSASDPTATEPVFLPSFVARDQGEPSLTMGATEGTPAAVSTNSR